MDYQYRFILLTDLSRPLPDITAKCSGSDVTLSNYSGHHSAIETMVVGLMLQDMASFLSICAVGSHGATCSPVACRKILSNCLGHLGTLPSNYGQGSKSLQQTIRQRNSQKISTAGVPYP